MIPDRPNVISLKQLLPKLITDLFVSFGQYEQLRVSKEVNLEATAIIPWSVILVQPATLNVVSNGSFTSVNAYKDSSVIKKQEVRESSLNFIQPRAIFFKNKKK
jgi:hypothetical protein